MYCVQPHTSLYKQLLDEESKSENSRLPLGLERVIRKSFQNRKSYREIFQHFAAFAAFATTLGIFSKIFQIQREVHSFLPSWKKTIDDEFLIFTR